MRILARAMRDSGGMRDESGMATVLACFCAMALLAFTVLAVQVGAAAIARQRAETAADLGALAGASKVLSGSEVACAAATEVVTANGGAIESCALVGADIQIVVATAVELGPMTRRAEARARAGPIAEQAP